MKMRSRTSFTRGMKGEWSSDTTVEIESEASDDIEIVENLRRVKLYSLELADWGAAEATKRTKAEKEKAVEVSHA